MIEAQLARVLTDYAILYYTHIFLLICTGGIVVVITIAAILDFFGYLQAKPSPPVAASPRTLTTTEHEVFETLQTIFRRVFEDETIVLRPDMLPTELPQWDSMNHCVLMVTCEEVFDIRFSTCDIMTLDTIDGIVARIVRRMDQQQLSTTAS